MRLIDADKFLEEIKNRPLYSHWNAEELESWLESQSDANLFDIEQFCKESLIKNNNISNEQVKIENWLINHNFKNNDKDNDENNSKMTLSDILSICNDDASIQIILHKTTTCKNLKEILSILDCVIDHIESLSNGTLHVEISYPNLY